MTESASGASVSVVIPAWNGRKYLAACLDALLAQEPPGFEVIVVDNASADGSADLVAAGYPQVQLICNRSNLGFAGACNVGSRAGRGEVLILLNQDTRVRPGWLRALLRAFDDPLVGAAGCKILYPDGQTIQHAGGWIEWPLALAHHYGQGERDAGQWDVPRQVEYVTGAAMAFRRDVLDQVGFLDEEFWPGYFEDSDFCFRVRKAGYEVWYIPDAVLVHEETTSLTDAAAISRAYHRGRLRFALKHLPPQRFLEEFVPAEQASCPLPARGPAGDLLGAAYLEAIPMAASLLPRRWRADAATIDRVLESLAHLYRPPVGDSMSFVPSLREFEFHSSVPAIGPLIARLRSLWYGVAAKWAIRSLIQQQEAINQQQDVYVRSLVSLSREVARLALHTEKVGGAKGGRA